VTGGYMALSCFSNGALTRQAVRDRFGLDWDGFSAVLRESPAGNDGKLMIPFLAPEITPTTDHAIEDYSGGLTSDDREGCVRGVVEGQFLNMFHHSDWMGDRPKSIRATGGASANREILQVCADVFNATVDQFEVTDSVSLGAALRAAHSIDDSWNWQRLTEIFCKTSGEAIKPSDASSYDGLKKKFGSRLAACLR